MYIKSLELTDFRNYKNESFSFCEGTNLIYGLNAQGKTNILEALHVFFTGRSHRTGKDKNLIRQQQDLCSVKTVFQTHGRDFEGELKISGEGKKKLTINGVAITKLSRLSEYGRVVMFAPEDLSLVKGIPTLRRRFLDMSISQIHPKYISLLGEYLKVLNQRNNLLKEIKKNPKAADTLFVWDSKLCELSGQLTVIRRKFVKVLLTYAKPVHQLLAGEDFDICYISGSAPPEIERVEEISAYLTTELDKKRQRDIDQGQTGAGAHRDDLSFLLNGQDARVFASQGQQRSIVLNLKMSLTEQIKSEFGEYPLLLLDDITSELDQNRRGFLLRNMGDKQVFITCTDKERELYQSQIKYFYINNGQLVRQD